jgi:parallel beta-helix repeat protein
MNRTTILSALSVLVLLSSADRLLGGPLNPPAGPVASTAKPLSEVEPATAISAANTPGDADCVFKIAQPGSYYLTGNLTGADSKSGIKITVSGVTLDLRGFALLGVANSTQGVVVTGAGVRDIAITNGTVTGWGLSGIDTFSATHCRVEGVRGSGNGGGALRIGAESQVRACTATLNAGAGISTESGCVVENCNSSANVSRGFFTQSNCAISGCVAEGNAGAGFDAFTGCTITRCNASGNTTGIQASGDCVVTQCSVRANTGIGMLIGIGSTVSACAVGNNTGDGIRISSGCHVFSNVCRSNGLAAGDGAGIHATGDDNRIEGNNCTGADRGIDVDAAGNFVVRNTCSGNTTANWDVATGNICLVVQAATSGAVLGSNGGTAPGSTDPNANFSY